ncbi:hypothetical protein [Prochlorococcus marinus]|uniref:hypothetical protein n=1 Tax=Prochlorococcus marinus TaxID=1219 RepID=UPI001ADC71B0|nr:hypothetical protein [Prochlorococcus marinus]MBO8204582.1 hypothetical protein [Prochlorococcus marinus CUG1415]MBW3043870.1 hypothetical protein [Prochlorococcus marinus str. MU1415]
MKCLLIASLILGITAPVQARPYGLKPALKVEECTSATFQKLHTTWREPKHDPRAIIALSHNPKVSNLGLYLGYELEKYKHNNWDTLGAHPPILIKDAKKMYKPNDRIKLCLKFVPVECRKYFDSDVRGEIYSITNERTRKIHYGRYGKNACGGA